VRTSTVAVPGGSLFVYEWGRPGDPALLYWDGLGGTGLHANELAPILVEEYGLRVLAPDPPGHGRSDRRSTEAYRPSKLAELAAELLSALDGESEIIGFLPSLGISDSLSPVHGARRPGSMVANPGSGTRSGSRGRQ
jgi:pimeloyl-ACP methyl ester carboxylesterase